jgi:hypothetical protein
MWVSVDNEKGILPSGICKNVLLCLYHPSTFQTKICRRIKNMIVQEHFRQMTEVKVSFK